MGDQYGDARVGISRLFGLCFAFLFASSVGAVTIDVGPSDYRNFGSSGSHTSSGIRSTFGQQVRLPPTISGPTRILPVSRHAVVPYASAAARMRPFTSVHPASVAASAAVAGLFLAMEWYFDEEIGEWSVREVEHIPPIEGTGFRYSDLNLSCPSAGGFPTALAACEAGADCMGRQANSVTHRVGQFYDCDVSTESNTYKFTVSHPAIQCPPGSVFNREEGACQQYVSSPVIEGEYSVLAGELPNLPAQQVAEATGDAQRRYGAAPGYQDTQMTGPSSVTGPETTSTSTDPVTGETTVTNTSTTTNINYGDTTITTTNTTTSTTYQNGQQTGETVTTETPGELPVSSGGGAGDWPGFCEWAGVVCDWFNWTQEEPPPEQDLPAVIDDDFYQEKEISFGAKSCPPDHQIDLTPFLATSVAVSFQPLCDFAGLIYYMVMAASYIIAAYITIGVARNG